MIQQEENFMSMAKATFTMLSENNDAVSTIEAFVTARTRMGTLITEIIAAESNIKSNKTGIANDKNALKKEIASVAYEIVSIIEAFADETNNMELYKSVHYTEYQMARIRDEQFGPTLNGILKAATANEIELKKHGLEQEDIDDLTDLMEVWDGKKQSPRKAVIIRQTINQNQDQLIQELQNLLTKRCDNYAVKLKRKFPEFYHKYTNSRKVIELGVRHEKKENPTPPTNPTA